MKKFGVFSINDGDFEEDLEILGIGKISGNLRAFSVKCYGLFVGGTLESTKGSIITNAKKNNFLEVKRDLISAKEILVKGKCFVGGAIKAHHLEVAGSLKADSIAASTATMAGKIEINKEIKTTNAISIEINFIKNINVKGQITAPLVTLKFRPKYTKIANLPKKVFRLFGLLKHVKKEIIIENLRINANTLILDSLNPIDNVNFIFSDNCDIDVQKVEKIQGV